jgi:hypothetical protein
LNLKSGRPAIRTLRPFAVPFLTVFAAHSTAGIVCEAPPAESSTPAQRFVEVPHLPGATK